MSLKNLPSVPAARPCAGVNFQLSPRALASWDAGVRAQGENDRSISIYDVIGYDYWTGEGVTAKRIAAALRSIGPGPVTVNINSPGGDMFEGMAIYNLLREHEGEVTVKVLGLAASAASIIAMAGDTVQIARAGFLMIHNCWLVAQGNRHDLREFADTMEPFDAAMADVYAARSGQDVKTISKLMDSEAWLGGTAAIEQGFADDLLPTDQVESFSAAASVSSTRRVESALRATGMSKNEALRLIAELKAGSGDPFGLCGAGEPAATPSSALAVLQSFTLQ